MKRRYFYSLSILAFAITALPFGNALAQENTTVNHAAVLAPFVSDDTFAVALVDLANIDPPALVATLTGPLNLPPEEQQQAAQVAAAAKAMLDGLRTAGVRTIYLVAGMGDVHARGGPLAIIPLPASAQTTVRGQIQALVEGMSRGVPAIRFERHASGPLVVGSSFAVDRYSLLLSTERPDLTAPLSRLAADGATAVLVLAPGQDSRRVIRELWPKLPQPVSGFTAPILADRLKHLELAAKLSPQLGSSVAVEMTDPEAAAAVLQTVREIRQSIPTWPKREPADLLGASLDALNIHTEGTRVVGNALGDGQALGKLGAVFVQAIDASRESAHRNLRMSNLKRIMIAMFNYEATKRSLPPSAIRDEEGKPLLSWRVAILPHLGQQALYNQFRLNEPWDSPHNIALVKRMPSDFADPDPKLAALAREGKTTFQVPVGPETIFFKNEGTRLSEITDGTSMTIAVVEVVPERAVEWTKPADWEVNMQNPLDGARRSDRNGFAAARCDGSVAFYRNDTDAATWRALLTRAGKDAVPR
jgi:hypothetical protein